MPILQTERLIVRNWEQSDTEKAFLFWGNKETMHYCAGGMTKEEVEQTVASYIRFQDTFGYTTLFPVVEKETNDLIGICGFQKTGDEDVLEFLYHYRQDTWGKGYAFEAATSIFPYIIETLNPKKVIASAAVENIGSWKILEKLNFTFIEEKWFEDTQMTERCYEYIV